MSTSIIKLNLPQVFAGLLNAVNTIVVIMLIYRQFFVVARSLLAFYISKTSITVFDIIAILHSSS